MFSELERLSAAFGIGIIRLDLEEINASVVVYPAKTKSELDWETMSKLSDQNPDFKKFLEDVKIDFDSMRIHRSEYDDILEDADLYIEKLKK